MPCSSSPVPESRIPKPAAASAAGEYRKQRYAPKMSPERSSPSGGSSGSAKRAARPKAKANLEDLEKGWVGLEDGHSEEPFVGGTP